MIDIRLSHCHIFLVLLLLEGSNADTANYIRGARQLSKDNISKEETTHDQFEHIVKGCVNGHNLKLFADRTVDECAALCNAQDDCYGFEYGVAYGGGGVYKPQDCQLQSSSNTAGCNGGYHNLDFYKKERPIDQFDHVVKGCVNGQNLKLYDDMTADECATLCNARDDCYGFEYGVAYGGRGDYMPRDCQLQSSSNTDDCNGGYHNLDFYKKERPIDQFPLEAERYIEVPEISNADIVKVMDWIKAELTMELIPFCWKNSYGRGVGVIPGRMADCPKGYIQDGATCRRPPHDIYSPSRLASCPSGFVNMGLTCFRNMKTYWKGGCTTIFKKYPCRDGYVDMGCHCHQDAVSLGHNSMICPNGYFQGPFARCYKNCPAGYTNTGEFCHRTLHVLGINAMTCKTNEDKWGARCFPKGNGGCYSHQEKDVGLCYNKCAPGSYGVGPVCWGKCASSQTDCVAACAESQEECGMAIADQVMAPLVIAVNIATLGLGGKGASFAQKVGSTHSKIKKLSKLFKSKKLKKALDTFEAVDGAQDILKVYKKMRPVRRGMKLVNAADTVNTYVGYYGISTEIFDAIQEYQTAYAEEFVALTNQNIADTLDSHFEPTTSYFLKTEWAKVQLDEIAEAKNWNIARTVLTALDLVDPTGVVGLVAAYAHPICHTVTPFPCIEADLRWPGCRW